MLLAVVGAMAYFLELDKVLAIVAGCRPLDLSLAVLCFLAGTFCYAWRWRFLLPDGTPWWPTFHAANLGHAGNILIPGRAGEPARIMALARIKACSAGSATSSVLVEKFVELPTRVAFCGLAMLAGLRLDPHFIKAGLAVILVAGSLFAALLVFQHRALEKVPRWLGRLPRLEEERVRIYLHDLFAAAHAIATPGKALSVIALTLSTWSFFTLAAWFTATALGIDHDSVALALLSMALVTPTGPTQPGLFHASLIAPVVALGYPSESITAWAVLLHLYQMVLMVGLGALGWLVLDRVDPA